MSRDQAEQLARDYIPWDRQFGRQAFARRFHTSVRTIDYWLDVKRYRLQALPMELTDDDKRDAAQACRLAAVQAEKDRDAQASPTVRERFQSSINAFRKLAAKFEDARRQ